jgi:hypothetical protein
MLVRFKQVTNERGYKSIDYEITSYVVILSESGQYGVQSGNVGYCGDNVANGFKYHGGDKRTTDKTTQV